MLHVLNPASCPGALLALPGAGAAPVRVQPGRERPGRHVGLAPYVPDSGGIRTPLRPGGGPELKETNVTGQLVVGPWVELTLADRGIEEPVTRDPVPAGRIEDGRDNPLLPVCLLSWNPECRQSPTDQGSHETSPLHE